MRKTILILLILSFASWGISAKTIPAGFVDLALPSGTLWKSTNEQGLYTYISAKYYFGNALPNKAQFEELLYNCTWKWTGKGYKVTGPNQNFIYIPFDGYEDCDEDSHDVGIGARIWTLNNASANFAYYCAFYDNYRGIVEDSNCLKLSVRLVINE